MTQRPAILLRDEHPNVLIKDTTGNKIPIESIRYEEDEEGVWLIEVIIDLNTTP